MSNQFPPYQQQPSSYQQPQQPPFYQEPQKQSGSGCGWGLLIGCGGIVLVSVLACAGGVWYVQQNFDKWIVGLVREGIVAVIEGSEIPAGEKTEVVAQVDRVVDAYKARQINQQDMERLMEQLQESPVFMLMSLWGMEKHYLDPSGLADEEKAAGRRAFERALRAVYEKKIEASDLQDALPDQFDEDGAMNADNADAPDGGDAADAVPTGELEMSQPKPVTDEDVRKMIADVKKLADDAGIPDEPFTIDIGDEVKKVVDEALAGKGVP
jgi:hypothetical protein